MAKDILEKEPSINQGEATDRRMVYGGEYANLKKETTSRTNRQVKRRNRSPLSLFVIIMAASILVVFYIWNKITVNRLANEINDLQNQQQKILSANEILRSEINQKSKLERIGKIATEKLDMVYPKDQPVWFELTQAHQQPKQ